MTATLRISSKRQITIPAKMFAKMGLSRGDRLFIELKDGKLITQKSQHALEELAGSLKLPPKLSGLSSEALVNKAKRAYFKKSR